MKPLSTLLTLSTGVLASASTAAQSARIYTFDTEQQTSTTSSHGKTLSADTARLILAQRLGSSQFSQLGDVDEGVLEQLNTFGGAQQSILGAQDGNGDVSKLLVVVEGVDKDIASSGSKSSSGDFVVEKVSDELVQESLIDNLLISKTKTANSCEYDFENDDILGSLVFNVLDTEKCLPKDAIFQQTGDKTALSNLKVSSWMGRSTSAVLKIKSQSSGIASVLETIFPELSTLAENSKQESTVVLLPTTSISSNVSSKKKSTTNNKVTRRDSQFSRRASDDEDDDDHLSTLLPVCHTSNSTCTEATNNCSGHGTCYKKYSTSGKNSGDCYACRCERTVVRKNSDGTVKTVQWGGPACQKKDVSIPFWLLAGFTVLLVGVVTWAIGLLYSVGSEELPSVIGAGVSGGKAQK